METPNVTVQAFLSIFKCVLVFFIVIDLALVGLFYGYIHNSFNGTNSSIQVSQDGYQNTQEFINGTPISKD